MCIQIYIHIYVHTIQLYIRTVYIALKFVPIQTCSTQAIYALNLYTHALIHWVKIK